MSLASKKILAILMVCLTAFGFLLSVFLLFQVWHFRQPVTESSKSGLDQASSYSKPPTKDWQSSIKSLNVYTSTLYLNDATNALAQTMQSTNILWILREVSSAKT